MLVYKEFGYKFDIQKLKMERARQGKSMHQVAELAMLDIKTIVRIEKCRVIPRIQTVGKIANALGKDIEEFICPSASENNLESAICTGKQKDLRRETADG